MIALSEVNDEYEEMLLKAASVLGALGHVKHPGQRGPPGSEPTPSTMPPSQPLPQSISRTLPEEGKQGVRSGGPTSGGETLPAGKRGSAAAALGGTDRRRVPVGSSVEGSDVTEEQRRVR